MPAPAANDGFGFLHESRRAIFFGGEAVLGRQGRDKNVGRGRSRQLVISGDPISSHLGLCRVEGHRDHELSGAYIPSPPHLPVNPLEMRKQREF